MTTGKKDASKAGKLLRTKSTVVSESWWKLLEVCLQRFDHLKVRLRGQVRVRTASRAAFASRQLFAA